MNDLTDNLNKALDDLQAKVKAARLQKRQAVKPPIEAIQTEKHISTTGLCRLHCPLCGGSGWIRDDSLSIYDKEFGKLTPCPNIPIWDLVGSVSGLADSEINLNWENLLILDESIRNAKAAAEALIQKGYGWLTFWGDYGTAKTHILKIITALILQGRQQAVYIRMSELLDDLRSAFDADNPNAEAQRRLAWYSDVHCLAIDELDRINQTAWATERQFTLLDKRYQQGIRRKGITLFAMNINPSLLEGYLSDRIMDGRFKIIKIGNQSLRPGISWEDHEKLYDQAYK